MYDRFELKLCSTEMRLHIIENKIKEIENECEEEIREWARDEKQNEYI